jgi:hypothetical protein
LRRRHVEAECERAEQQVAEPHQGAEIALDVVPEARNVGPAVDAVKRLTGLDVWIIRRDREAEIEAFLEVGPVARINRIVHRHVAAIVLVDADLHPGLERQREEARRRRERARNGVRRHTVIDKLEGAPLRQRALEIAADACVGVSLAPRDRRHADNR